MAPSLVLSLGFFCVEKLLLNPIHFIADVYQSQKIELGASGIRIMGGVSCKWPPFCSLFVALTTLHIFEAIKWHYTLHSVWKWPNMSHLNFWPKAPCFQKVAKMDHFCSKLIFVCSKCKSSSLRLQCWMRLFLRLSNT